MENNRDCFINLTKQNDNNNKKYPKRRSTIGFLHNLSQRLGRRFQNDLIYSSSTEDINRSHSLSSTVIECTTKHFHTSCCNIESDKSCSSSSSDLDEIITINNDCDDNRNHHHNDHTDDNDDIENQRSDNYKHCRLHQFSSIILGKTLQNFSSLNSKSVSCSSTPLKQQNKTNKKSSKPQQRILRQPVTYVYLKGMSGLPTRRVPRSSICCNYVHHR